IIRSRKRCRSVQIHHFGPAPQALDAIEKPGVDVEAQVVDRPVPEVALEKEAGAAAEVEYARPIGNELVKSAVARRIVAAIERDHHELVQERAAVDQAGRHWVTSRS